jgi:hypothetical protein
MTLTPDNGVCIDIRPTEETLKIQTEAVESQLRHE